MNNDQNEHFLAKSSHLKKTLRESLKWMFDLTNRLDMCRDFYGLYDEMAGIWNDRHYLK